MSIFTDQKEFLIEFREVKIYESLRDAINDFGLVLKDLIVTKQLYELGIDGNSKKLRGYSRRTIKLKISKKQPTDRTTLHDSEDFVRSINIDSYDDRFEISSNVSYDKYIIKNYGEDVLSPTNENMKDFMLQYFIPKLKEYVDSKITK